MSVFSAPAMKSEVCLITGVVQSIENREHIYKPESWRKSWGLPKSITYIDIKMNLSEVVPKQKDLETTECTLELLSEKTFQLRSKEERSKLEKGSCFRATTQFSGDEFAIGQWVWDIESC